MSGKKKIRRVWKSAEYEEVDSAIKKIYMHSEQVFQDVDFELVEAALALISKINHQNGTLELPG